MSNLRKYFEIFIPASREGNSITLAAIIISLFAEASDEDFNNVLIAFAVMRIPWVIYSIRHHQHDEHVQEEHHQLTKVAGFSLFLITSLFTLQFASALTEPVEFWVRVNTSEEVSNQYLPAYIIPAVLIAGFRLMVDAGYCLTRDGLCPRITLSMMQSFNIMISLHAFLSLISSFIVSDEASLEDRSNLFLGLAGGAFGLGLLLSCWKNPHQPKNHFFYEVIEGFSVMAATAAWIAVLYPEYKALALMGMPLYQFAEPFIAQAALTLWKYYRGETTSNDKHVPLKDHDMSGAADPEMATSPEPVAQSSLANCWARCFHHNRRNKSPAAGVGSGQDNVVLHVASSAASLPIATPQSSGPVSASVLTTGSDDSFGISMQTPAPVPAP